MPFVVEFVAAIVALVFLFVTYRKWCLTYWSRRDIPYLPPSLMWGNMGNPFSDTQGLKIAIKICYDEFKKLGHKHGGMYLMSEPVYVPVELDLVKNILSRDFSHFMGHGLPYDAKKDPLSAHIFNLEGDEWKSMRVKLTPTFTSGKMKTMFSTLLDCGKPLLDHIDKLSENGELWDVKEILACYTTDVIGSCAFGLECNSFKDPNSEFRTYGRAVFAPPASFSRKVTSLLSLVIPEIRKLFYFNMVEGEVENFFLTVIKNIMDYRKANKVYRKDFIQLFLEMNEKAAAAGHDGLTFNQIAAQSFVFFLGGFETSSATMTFVLHELSFNQDIQDKVREEVRETMKRHDGKLTYDGIMEMKYLDLVVHETLRKFPIVPFIMRNCSNDYKVPNTDLTIKKETKVFISTLGIHRDKEFYPDPEKFIPERFTEENKAKRPQYSFIPFGEGPRICIGLRFGLMQAKTCLAMLLDKYRILPAKGDNYKIKFEAKAFNLNKDGDVYLKAEKL